MAERSIYQGAISQFQREHPGIDVELMEIPGDYYQKVLVMIAARQAPDLMWMGQSFTEFAQRGVFLDISDRLKDQVKTEDFQPDAVGWYRMNGKQYGIPFGLDLKFIAYNRKLFNEAGVGYPTDDWTFDQFLQAARRLTRDIDGDGRIDQYGFRGDLEPSLFGASFISPDGSHAACQTAQMIEYLQTNLELCNRYHVSPAGKQSESPQAEAMEDYVGVFRQGRTAMMRMATWNLPLLREQCADMDWDIVANPKVERRGHWASSQAIVISAQTQHPDAAWELCKVFLSDQFQHAMSWRVVPTKRAVAQQMVNENRQKPMHLQTLLTASQSMSPNPRVANLAELLQIWLDGCESVWAQRQSPSQAMALAADSMDRVIRERRQVQ